MDFEFFVICGLIYVLIKSTIDFINAWSENDNNYREEENEID